MDTSYNAPCLDRSWLCPSLLREIFLTNSKKALKGDIALHQFAYDAIRSLQEIIFFKRTMARLWVKNLKHINGWWISLLNYGQIITIMGGAWVQWQTNVTEVFNNVLQFDRVLPIAAVVQMIGVLLLHLHNTINGTTRVKLYMTPRSKES